MIINLLAVLIGVIIGSLVFNLIVFDKEKASLEKEIFALKLLKLKNENKRYEK